MPIKTPENETDLYDIKNITNATSIQVQNVETTIIESKILNENIVNNNTDFSIDIDTNFAKKFEMVENIKDNDSYNYDEDIIDNIVNNNTDFSIDIDKNFAKKFEMVENIKDNDSYNYNSETIIPYNVESIHEKGVKIIYNVYQSKYSNGAINGTGFGDFIRGSYFLLEFCEKYNFEAKILFNNCISKFLLPVKYNFNLEKIQPILANIDMFHNNNFKEYIILEDQTILQPNLDLVHIMSDFVKYIMNEPVNNGHSFIYCIPYPIENISEKSKTYMQTILEPIDEIKYIVHKYLNNIGLKFKDYLVYHIRSGDDYLNKENKIFYQKYLEKLKREIKNYLYSSESENYLVIADNNEIKILLKKEFPQLKIILKEITHFGEGVELEEEKVKNTLIDFYLLSFSNKIISLSAYKHGSGFSFWCAKTFNIPYISKYI